MFRNVSQLMQQCEPEIGDPVMPQCQRYDGPAVIQHRRPVEKGLVEMPLDHQSNAVTLQMLDCEPRAFIERGKTCQFCHPDGSDDARLERLPERALARLSQHAKS